MTLEKVKQEAKREEEIEKTVENILHQIHVAKPDKIQKEIKQKEEAFQSGLKLANELRKLLENGFKDKNNPWAKYF